MALNQFLSTLFVLFLAVVSHAQITVSGLTFDGGDVVSLFWAYQSDGPAKYNLYLCAGDETTNSYVSGNHIQKRPSTID
jgi:hypothetical protein